MACHKYRQLVNICGQFISNWNSDANTVLLHLIYFISLLVGPVAQSVVQLAMGWEVRGSNPGGGEIFCTCPDRPWGPPSLLYNGYRVFRGGKMRPGRDVTLTPHPFLVPRSKNRVALYLYTP
jgi:hypothetical protein